MNILIVSATRFEVQHLITRYHPKELIVNTMQQFRKDRNTIGLLTTGVGMVQTAFFLGKALSTGSYDLVINAGICGVYSREVPLGTVIQVTEDQFPESGIEKDGTFRSFYEVGLIPVDEYPFVNGKLVNTLVPELQTLKRLKRGSGNTVNTLQTDPERIDRLLSAFPADVESMEGAAFLFACLSEMIPCVQIRAVSNYVGERDRKKWKIQLALKNLDKTMMEVMEEIGDRR